MHNTPNSSNTKSTKLKKIKSQLAFTPLERKALWILSFLLISGTSLRMYQNHQFKDTLELIPISKAITQNIDELTPIVQDETVFPININKATQPDLELLPGIGPVKALAIIEYINANGPFQNLDEVQNVNGLGPSTIRKIEKFIVMQP